MKARKYFLIAFLIILVDQVVKLIVKFNMTQGLEGEIKLLGDFFKLHFIENRGAAFGMTISGLLSSIGLDMTEETGKLILTLFSIVAVGGIGYVLYRISDHKSPLPLFIAMIFGGALGNIIDRVFYGVWFDSMNDYAGGLFHGRVVDMFYVDIYTGWTDLPLIGETYLALWPIFNIADAAISIGIITILIFQQRFFKMDEEANNQTEKPSDNHIKSVDDSKGINELIES